MLQVYCSSLSRPSRQVVFGREVSWGQLIGCLLVVASLPLAHAGELEAGRPALLPSVLMTSQVAAFLSTAASIGVEVSCEEERKGSSRRC